MSAWCFYDKRINVLMSTLIQQKLRFVRLATFCFRIELKRWYLYSTRVKWNQLKLKIRQLQTGVQFCKMHNKIQLEFVYCSGSASSKILLLEVETEQWTNIIAEWIRQVCCSRKLMKIILLQPAIDKIDQLQLTSQRCDLKRRANLHIRIIKFEEKCAHRTVDEVLKKKKIIHPYQMLRLGATL